MQLTYKLPIDSLNDTFLETVKKQFVGKEVNITIEEAKETSVISQKQLFAKCQELYTFSHSDFKRIQNHTDLKITIL
ncbi:hypothetical protein [Dyadobacter sp. LHD-138]|uniref:hypothetical protein n=1 Tax=Dyadobacter sp. LHD-138 TaxID=3071413 RepID=UPI0027E02279|nr:hypothetical protein [Dyadobacter sp. LHD-138]MDQ6476790.1 hypothetical protein [Dyadobacter sp. LHD-138]